MCRSVRYMLCIGRDCIVCVRGVGALGDVCMCSVCAVCMRCVCSVCMQCVCSVYTVCMQCVCSVCACRLYSVYAAHVLCSLVLCWLRILHIHVTLYHLRHLPPCTHYPVRCSLVDLSQHTAALCLTMSV